MRRINTFDECGYTIECQPNYIYDTLAEACEEAPDVIAEQAWTGRDWLPVCIYKQWPGGYECVALVDQHGNLVNHR